jgi:hypothetical protein
MKRHFILFSGSKEVSVQCVDRVESYVIGIGEGVMYLVIVIGQRAPKSIIVRDFQVLLLCFVVYNRLKV